MHIRGCYEFIAYSHTKCALWLHIEIPSFNKYGK